jgi:proline iminopeptidase
LHERGKMRVVESGFVPAADGVRLYFETHGQGGDYLVIPGAALVQDDLAPLAAGRTVVFFDTRNRGRSDPVPHDGHVGVPTEVDDIDTIRRHLGLERISLLGWSYVGLVAALYAARYSNHADRLVMVCPVPPRDHDYGTSARDPGFEAALSHLENVRQSGLAERDPVEFAREWRRAFVPTRMGDPSAFERVKSDASGLPNEWPDHARSAQERVWKSLGARFDFRSVVREATVPALVVQGEADVIPPAASREWAEAIPNARLLTLPGVGHFPWAEAPHRFFEAVEAFLREPLSTPDTDRHFGHRNQEPPWSRGAQIARSSEIDGGSSLGACDGCW